MYYVTHYISPKITTRQSQIISGTILGGSSIVKPTKGKNCYLSMRSKDGLWLDYKARELKSLASLEPITIEKTNRWHSLCYPIFTKFREEFYKGKERKLRLENLELLQDIGLAMWFGDCGKWRDNNVILNTNIWGEKGSKIIKKYIECCGWKCEIFEERGGCRVSMEEQSSRDFLEIIVPQLPGFFTNRLTIPFDIPNQDQQ